MATCGWWQVCQDEVFRDATMNKKGIQPLVRSYTLLCIADESAWISGSEEEEIDRIQKQIYTQV